MNLPKLGDPDLYIVLPNVELSPILASSTKDFSIDPRNRPGFSEDGEAHVAWQMEERDFSRTAAGGVVLILGNGF